MAAVAGAGPKRMTDVNRKVSDIEACTGTPGTRSVNEPQATARMPRSSHSGIRPMAGSWAIDWATAKSPATVTAATKRDNTRFVAGLASGAGWCRRLHHTGSASCKAIALPGISPGRVDQAGTRNYLSP